MSRKYITVGSILTLIGIIGAAFIMLALLAEFFKNPIDPNNVANVTEKATLAAVDEATPEEVGIIASLAKVGGVGAAILILLFIIFWKKIKDFRIPLQ